MNKADKSILSTVAALVGEGNPALNSFERLFRGASPEVVEELLGHVDDSDYSLRDWVDALAGFDGWLECRGECERPLEEMLGYIHCCTRMGSPGLISPNLKVIVCQALTDFGFDAVSDAQK